MYWRYSLLNINGSDVMKKKALVIAVVVGAVVVGALYALGYINGPGAEQDGEKFSVETTTMGRLLATPCTRQLFATKFGAEAMLENPHINVVQHLTMRRLAAFPLADLNDMKLRFIQAEFASLDPHSPACQREQHEAP